MSTPKSSTSVKKSLSFSPDTKEEEETDSPPKSKGIRGGGRRRKAQLALVNGEELSPDDPRHAYYVLIHEDMKSGKPTASVKPIMSGEHETVEAAGAEKISEAGEEAETSDNTRNVNTDTVGISESINAVQKVSHVVNDGQGAPALGNIVENGVRNEHIVTTEISTEVKLVKLVTSEENDSKSATLDEKPPLVVNNNTESLPSVNEEKPADRDWSKPKPIRGRKKKPKADMNGNEPSKPEEKLEVTSKHDDIANGADDELQQKKLVINGDS